MEIKSYLLGKKAGGGGGEINNQNKDITINQNGTTSVSADAGYTGLGTVGITTNVQPNLESKSITITENGTTTVTPATGKDGLSQVSVTTNVSGGGTDEYFGNQISKQTSSSNTVAHQLIKKIPSFTIPYNVKSLADAFSGFYKLESVPLFDTSNITNMNNMFYNCSSLTAVPLFNTSNVTNMGNMFWGCSNLESVPLFDTGNVTIMANMFNTCSKLKNVPLFNTSKVTSFVNMLKFTRDLTDTSLDNILQMCINATSYTGTKTLSTMGIENGAYSASRIQALPHYQDFINAGWTIGY